MIRTGKCNQCGKCCLRAGGLMTECPVIELHEDKCKFYVDELGDGKVGHCLIFARGQEPIETVKDRFGNLITPEQIRWFNDNCPSYPAVEDAEADLQLLPGCGFKFEEEIT